MITSGLVLTLNADAARADQALAALRTRPEFAIGERNGQWLPVAMEVADDAASRAAHDWLNQLPGVDFVDVVYVNFEGDCSRRREEADLADSLPLPPPHIGGCAIANPKEVTYEH
jgi:hypothetical protein